MTPNWRHTVLKALFVIMILLLLCSGGSWLVSQLSPTDAETSTSFEVQQEESVSIVVETFKVLATGQLDPFHGIDVLVSDGGEFIKVGETAMKTIAGIPAPVWEGDVSIGSWVTIGLPENCAIWKVGADLWEGAYHVSAEYAEQDLPLKFQIVCGENIPSPTPGPTNPPSGPTDTPFVPTNTPPPPTNTPPPPPTNTPPPPTNTPEPTTVGCNCPTPEEPLPTLPAPTEWNPTPTSTPIH